MQRILTVSLFLLVALSFFSCSTRSGKPRVLLFTKTAGYHHASIPAGIAAIQKIAAEKDFTVDTTTDSRYFTEDSLKNYTAVIFLSTTGDVLDNYQEADFERYIQAGGAFVGIHAATDTEPHWGWYNRLVGALFDSHPRPQMATLNVVDASHPSTSMLPKEWKREDEWYNFKNIDSNIHVLMTIDESSYDGGKNGATHPMAWYHENLGGRAWYTELGHTDASFSDSLYLAHITGGIEYAIGKNQKLDYAKATTLRVPEENRFKKTTLALGEFFEPTEMTILPNLDILVAQRRGELLLYKQSEKKMKQAGFLDVYYKAIAAKVNVETGLLGIKADPDFANNHFIYLYYSPVGISVDRLSRFTFENDTILPSSEKVILDVATDREICCHTGGSIAFGPNRTLFVSTGDNSTPFDEPGGSPFNLHAFAPLDDREGYRQYDARRSAGNANDLRGKILRIAIAEDGSYSIPDGNLFGKGVDSARAEIYVMGNRNPYRISVDKRTNYLYWGEVGPDANNDSMDTRGPRGYDEVNQARKAGNFGWPYFIGNNYAYHSYDYATGNFGPAFDKDQVRNTSNNNTGLTNLPSPQPAFIWYPYGDSPEFPSVGSGGRTAMAGPVYYAEDYAKDTRFPDYFNDKLFIYEWIRGWIKVVTMKPNGDFDKMEPFMAGTKFNAPIDMEMGPDGRMYILEYGSGWFSRNEDAGLFRIDYNGGNRAPEITDVEVAKKTGKLPFDIEAKATVSDPEKDKLSYEWKLGDTTITTTEPVLKYSATKAGELPLTLTVIDAGGARSESEVINLYAGNETPELQINVEGNQRFYFPGQSVKYKVDIKDADDPAAGSDAADLFVSARYQEGNDQAQTLGHQQQTSALLGKNIAMSMDCKTCHKEAGASVGPSFTEVAEKYRTQTGARDYLGKKIMSGGSGVWGEVAMPAHPNIAKADLDQIVDWVLSIGAAQSEKSLPASGALSPTLGKPFEPNGQLSISAVYSDKGAAGVKPLSASGSIVLRSPVYSLRDLRQNEGFTFSRTNNKPGFKIPAGPSGWIKLDDVDFTGINSVVVSFAVADTSTGNLTVELRANEPNGTVIQSGTFSLSKAAGMERDMVIPIGNTAAGLKRSDLYLLIRREQDAKGSADIRKLEFKNR